MTQKTYELDPDEVLIFFRTEGWYPIQAVKGVDLREQAQDHAVRNPGTLKIEDKSGNSLWVLQ